MPDFPMSRFHRRRPAGRGHVESRRLTRLSEAAILAAIPCPLDHLAPQAGRNDHWCYERSELIRSDRIRKSESNSAKSTNPSASRCSGPVSGVPSSYLSSNSVSRCGTPSGSRNFARSSGLRVQGEWLGTYFAASNKYCQLNPGIRSVHSQQAYRGRIMSIACSPI